MHNDAKTERFLLVDNRKQDVEPPAAASRHRQGNIKTHKFMPKYFFINGNILHLSNNRL